MLAAIPLRGSPIFVLRAFEPGADAHSGILGLPAAELHLSVWIDGSGQKIGPVRLEDYRDKVIYLYFFQDW